MTLNQACNVWFANMVVSEEPKRERGWHYCYDAYCHYRRQPPRNKAWQACVLYILVAVAITSIPQPGNVGIALRHVL